MSSGLGTRVGLPGLADYSATKSGIERYTMGVARDLGRRGITANVVEAGLMESGMEPPDPETLKALVGSLSLQRMGHPDEIAAAIGFLAGLRVVRHRRGAGRPRRLQRLIAAARRVPRRSPGVGGGTRCAPRSGDRRRPV